VPTLAVADIVIQTDTGVRGFERRADSDKDELVYSDTEQGGISFHLDSWGRQDSAGSDLHMEDPEGELLYERIRCRKPFSQFEAGVGRRHLFAGVSNQSVDGLQLNAEIGSNLSAHLFWSLPGNNIDSQDWKKHRHDARFLANPLMIDPSYQYFSHQGHFGKENSQNDFSHFLQDEEEIPAISGTDIIWQGLGAVDVGIRGRHYDYEIRHESALYMAGLLTVNTSSGSQIGIEVGRMDGETADNIYDLYRGYFYWQQPLRIKTKGFISGDALYIAYDASVYGEDKSIQYTLSAGSHFFKNRMATKLSGIFIQDPYLNSDVGGEVTLHIHY
jgi:hypothetical protein